MFDHGIRRLHRPQSTRTQYLSSVGGGGGDSGIEDSSDSFDSPPEHAASGGALQRPVRIVLARHGESAGNVDVRAYVDTPDWRVPLTDRGHAQARAAGERLRDVVGPTGRVLAYFSPYLRTTDTMDVFRACLEDDRVLSVREEPRISEQQFGNFQNAEQIVAAKRERHEFGRFYYRFRSGEAGLDVYSRVSSFISTLVRDCQQYRRAGYDLDEVNVVIVTHGLSLRLFLMRWFQFSVEEFEATTNPDNASLVVMNRVCRNGRSWYELDEETCETLNLPSWCAKPKNVDLHRLEDAQNQIVVEDWDDDLNHASVVDQGVVVDGGRIDPLFPPSPPPSNR